MLICRHIKADGHRCGSPAMKGKPYCFFHMKLYLMHKRDLPEIPPIEDSTSIFLAIGQVFRALHYETVDCKRAGLMLYALQTAFAVAKHREQAEPLETVCSVHNLAGDPLDFTEAAKFGMDMLAPVDEVCDPTSDCAGSNHSCEKPRASVDHDASAGRQSSFDPQAPFTPESVAIMEHAIDDPTLTTAERKKYVFAYVRYLKEQTAKNPPLENLSINAQSDPLNLPAGDPRIAPGETRGKRPRQIPASRLRRAQLRAARNERSRRISKKAGAHPCEARWERKSQPVTLKIPQSGLGVLPGGVLVPRRSIWPVVTWARKRYSPSLVDSETSRKNPPLFALYIGAFTCPMLTDASTLR